VLGPQHGSLGKTEASIRAAGGEVLQSWPQIGVVVATSTSADFASTVRGKPGVVAAGASRALAELGQNAARTARATAKHDLLEQTESVVDKAPVAVPRTTAVTPEPLEANLWGLRQIKADQAHTISQGSRDVVVGVLDSGVESTHPDLAPNFDASKSVGCVNEGVPDTSPAAWSPTVIDHGTHVAGTIAAARNGVGVAGVAPNVKISSVKLIDDDGFIYPEYAICAFVWSADHGIDVTNNSYFIDPWLKWCLTDPDQKAGIMAVNRAVAYSVRKDVVNVAALGNSNWDMSHDITDDESPNNGLPTQTRVVGNECFDMPAELPGVVTVTAIGPEGRKSYYSNYGILESDVTAPGGDSRQVANTPDANGRILSTVLNGGWGYKQGTSMASPHAAGVVALIRSKHPTWSVGKVVSSLYGRADRIACPPNPYDPDGTGQFVANCEGGQSGKGFYGAGVVDALDAVTR
jgi:subtilisin family serine protease